MREENQWSHAFFQLAGEADVFIKRVSIDHWGITARWDGGYERSCQVWVRTKPDLLSKAIHAVSIELMDWHKKKIEVHLVDNPMDNLNQVQKDYYKSLQQPLNIDYPRPRSFWTPLRTIMFFAAILLPALALVILTLPL